MPSKFTLYDLDTTTDYLGFESFCNDLMSREGYKSIQPLGGYKDKGRDAIHFDRSTGIATVLSYSVREDWENKLGGDLDKIKKHGHDCQRVVFVTAAEIAPSAFDKLRERIRKNYGWDFDLFSRDRIATAVDNHHADLLLRHPGVFPLSSVLGRRISHTEINRQHYAMYLLRQHAVWVAQYTPLLAEHRDLDTFVDLRESERAAPLPVSDLPDVSDVAILLGESGAGKTTSLWKIAVRAATRLLDSESKRIPVLINLRGWTSNKRVLDLLAEFFEPFDLDVSVLRQELRNGMFLLLIDGLNEVSQQFASDCAYDVANFLALHPGNRCVIACRSADFSPSLLPIGDVKPPICDPSVYEICRLNRQQMLDYARGYGARHATDIEPFLERLNVGADDMWERGNAALQLARIPLYLQVFLDVFRQTGQLPHSKAELLSGLVGQVLLREQLRGRLRIDRFGNEAALGYIAFRSTAQSYALRFEVGYARELTHRALELLRSSSLVATDVTLGELWGHLLSANFLKLVRSNAVEWLHQLLRDYFLGMEFAQIWRAQNHPDRDELERRLGDRTWDVACTVALAALGEQYGPEFLLNLMRAYGENARRAFDGQSDEMRANLLASIIKRNLVENDPETLVLKQLCRVLPYVDVVEALNGQFYDADVGMRSAVIEAISEMLFEHLPRVASGPDAFDDWYVDSAIRESRYIATRAATRRAAEILSKFLRSKDEFVSFYAAKGLYESDRTASVRQLRRLAASNDPKVRALVADVAQEWGID